MSTFSYQTPVQFWWKWILYKLTLVSQSGWPLPRVPLNQGGPPCSPPAWPPGPRQGWATGSDRFWLLELRVSRTFLDILRLICSVHGYPARRAASTADPNDPPKVTRQRPGTERPSVEEDGRVRRPCPNQRNKSERKENMRQPQLCSIPVRPSALALRASTARSNHSFCCFREALRLKKKNMSRTRCRDSHRRCAFQRGSRPFVSFFLMIT